MTKRADSSRPLTLSVALLAFTLLGAGRTRAQSAQTASIAGTVYDSIAHAPLRSAGVQLVDVENRAQAPMHATTDSLGRFAIGAVHDGRYLATFTHPILDSLGMRAPTYLVSVQGARAVRLDLATPPPQRLRAAYCGAPSLADSTGVVLGYLRDAGMRAPVVEGTVIARWLEVGVGARGIIQEVAERRARSDSSGWFVLCGVPMSTDVTMEVARAGDTSGVVPFRLPVSGVGRRDFYVGASERVAMERVDSTAADSTGRRLPPQRSTTYLRRGKGRLDGTVHGMYGAPLRGARVSVAGTNVEAVSDERGQFTLRGLPEGTQTLTARAVGYFPDERPVDVLADSAGSVDIVLASARSVLDTIRVVGQRVRSDKILAFDERRRTRPGNFLDSLQIGRLNPLQTTSLLRHASNMSVVAWFDRRSGKVVDMLRVRGSGVCLPAVYIDRMPIRLYGDLRELDQLIQPSEIHAIEMYTAGQAPMEFTRRGACATVVITTKW